MPTNYQKHFQRVAVLGTGTMGAQIAAHFVNCGVEVVLFGLSHEEAPEATAAAAVKKLPKTKPPALALPEWASRIEAADYTNDLEKLRGCSLVIEAVSENMEIKKGLFEKISPFLPADGILASNTSGLSLGEMSGFLPAAQRPRFFGVHFFNPPRYMPLVELVAHGGGDPEVLALLEGFVTVVAGKHAVRVNDTPAFIGNRLGAFSIVLALRRMEEFGLAADTVDALSGTLIGRAKSATFRTADIVGLDILRDIVAHLHGSLPDDPFREYLKLSPWVEGLIEQGSLGQKTGAGIYRKGKGGIEVFDPAKGGYRPSAGECSPEVVKVVKKNGVAGALRELASMDDPQAQFLWALHRDLFHYAAVHCKSLAASVRETDLVMRLGFGWREGVFNLWQKAGGAAVTELLDADAAALPEWAGRDFYTPEGAFSPSLDRYVRPPERDFSPRQLAPLRMGCEPSSFGKKFPTLEEDEHIRAFDLGEGIAGVAFKTKMHVLSCGLLKSMHRFLDEAEEKYDALVTWQGAAPFCLGANLYELLAAAKLGLFEKVGALDKAKLKLVEVFRPNLPKLEDLRSVAEAISDMQNLHMRLKHNALATVAAVDGMALGGGCELLLHHNRVVASINSHIGLVEVGVGVLPAAGGCKEMALRAAAEEDEMVFLSRLTRAFRNIATAAVSTSAAHARQMGYLREADKIVANPEELLYVARGEAVAMLEAGYRPPSRAPAIKVGGREAKANFLAELVNLLVGGFISKHDYFCAENVAEVLCGGALDKGEAVDAGRFLEWEKEGFLRLVRTEKTQARVEHTLKTGKPLRN